MSTQIEFNNTTTGARAKKAADRLEHRFKLGEDQQQKLVEQVAQLHIRDKLVPPARMHLLCPQPNQVRISYSPDDDKGILVHPHALGQMCGVAGIPKLYVNRLIKGFDWERSLFEYNLTTLFTKGLYLDRSRNPTKFLHRLVGSGPEAELRGFLSRNFNRHLASLPLLRGFVMACREVGAQPIEASSSAIRFSLKCFLPYVFEPIPGEFVAFGVVWSNSDFGAGRLRVSMSVMRISGGTTAILEDSMSRVHIGSVIQDSDLELSEETAAKEVDTQVSAIRDAVLSQLSPDPVNKLLTALEKASEEQLPWHRLKSELGRLLQKSEIEDVKRMLETGIDDIVDLPPPGMDANGTPIATRWWASNTVGWLASREQNAEKKADLQTLAGSLLKAS